MSLIPVTLRGALVTLEPLTLEHAEPLTGAGLHPSLWTLQPRPIRSAADMRAYVEQALEELARGQSLPFAVIHGPTGMVVGSTRYMDIALPHRRLEIGATWYTPAYQDRKSTRLNSSHVEISYAVFCLKKKKKKKKEEN